ncbi:hypothetical protein Tther_01287 [Tepidimonas thermarum]|uniref:NfeD-like C-terminal domain-containing protein n=1 Tax=Tepidimonas thermarum TaxID=335431 RepID=A0A554X1P0_9BURK|nr:NfeD family protein [Tepidimonas thermarum]TSE29767.1 hypothetical protein Tther_01287 [Tepidimonas thermarum]
MDDATLWWVLAGLAVVAELASGTFFLLMLAVGAAAGAVAAHAGLALTGQLVAAAAVGGGAVALWARWRRHHPKAPPPQANPDVVLDVGQVLHITQWAADGTARVRYRGADWLAEAAPGQPHTDGAWRITAVVGNRLIVEPAHA